MSDGPRPADLARLRTQPLSARRHKVRVADFARPVDPAAGLDAFLDGLGPLLAVNELRGLADAVAGARRAGRHAIWALGGHVVKCGVAPVLIDLMERGQVTALCLNGAAAIHDWEIAVCGATSEDVDASLPDGTFGTAEETGRAFADAARAAAAAGRGLGEVLGPRLESTGAAHRDVSLLAAAARCNVPVTVHVAIGCDVVHAHPAADGATAGAASFVDFRRLVTLVGELDGGVWLNVGSAVQLPEVFLKALSAARNLGAPPAAFATANLDMQRHYRTAENVLRRPGAGVEGARSFQLVGHHELQIPLLAAEILRRARGGP